MEGVNTSSRLPVIGTGFHVGGVRADREPPSRSWARIRTCLIDNPKDDEFSRRQEVWSYHSRNRGVVKSLLKKIPNVPFRVKKKNMKQKDIDTERERIRETIAKLPNISNSENVIGCDSPGRNAKTRPLGLSKFTDFYIRTKENIKISNESEDITTKIDTNNNSEINVVTSSEHLPNIKERTARTSPTKGNSKLEESSKKVSFSMNDLSTEIDERCASVASNSSTVSETAIENYGHTSHGIGDTTSRSVLDVFGNNNIGDSRTLDTSKRKQGNSVFKISDNHKNWFQRVLGDKELIASTEYENFARTPRAYTDRPPEDISQTGTIPPEKQYSRSGWNVYSQSHFYGTYSNKPNTSGIDKNDNKISKGPQTVASTKVGARLIESRLTDQSYKQNESEKIKRFDRTQQLQAQVQNRISERLIQSKSPERNNQVKLQERTSPTQTHISSRPADRVALNRSPDRLLPAQNFNRNVPQRQSKMTVTEQQFNDVGNGHNPNGSPSPTRFMGEYKLSKSPLPHSPGRYFPIFPTDGSPMRKIGGGGKNKMQKANSKSQPVVIPLQETETYIV